MLRKYIYIYDQNMIIKLQRNIILKSSERKDESKKTNLDIILWSCVPVFLINYIL